jgi:hypothetical protein
MNEFPEALSQSTVGMEDMQVVLVSCFWKLSLLSEV